ncbi:sucrase ferredoxin [Streptomyces boninensis]|uniref:sucrase ferredoxin n=1 Tax=Streptomyces boninensis TaxID=2039455 RepID=UPI003B2161EE
MTTCATASQALDEPLAGTAATAATWLLIEQNGPWGAKALTASHLDPALGRALEAATAGTGVRAALIRRPGRHADSGTAGHRRIFAAHTAPGAAWVRTTQLSDPAHLLDLDFTALGAGHQASFPGTPATGPLALVCTNGKRDRCCALLGRPLATTLAASAACDTWEITHIGGHRFSPTLLLLPHGYAYGRMTPHAVKEAVEALRDNRVITTGCRGRSTWDRPAQAAELALREHLGEDDADAIAVTGVTGAHPRWSVQLRHTAATWSIDVTSAAPTGATPTPASCGAAPLPQERWVTGIPQRS